MEFPFLQDLVLVFGLCVVVVLAFHRLKVVVGFLLTGALVGPGSLGLIGHPEEVEPSIAIFSRTLARDLIPKVEVQEQAHLARTILRERVKEI